MSDKGSPHFFHVFADKQGAYGDLASVIIDEGRHIPDDKRQSLARELHTSETAFINDAANADISIMHYQGEVDFAGTLALAASWLLTKLRGKPITAMHSRGGAIATWQEANVTWVQTNLAAMPPWHLKQLKSPEAVERLTAEAMSTAEHTMTWAWIDEAKGLIRARTFASDWEIPEAEGNGSGTMLLAARLNRSIQVTHGSGSVIFAKPGDKQQAALGGRIVYARNRRAS